MKNTEERSSFKSDVGTGGNREYKDTLFRKIFGSEENKKYLLSLYNAVNHTSYENPDDLEIMTMEDVLYVSMKNDIAFVLESEVNLYEHQSTMNKNMPVRGLLYTAKLLQNWLSENGKNLYQKKLVKIPTPKYVVFYNGMDEMEDRMELRLSDAFMKPVENGVYEWTAEVYNVNYGRNRELMEQCLALRQYADFVRMVRENYQEMQDIKSAITKAMDVAIEKNYLDGYFKKEKEGVFMTALFEVDKEVYENNLRKEAEEEAEIRMLQRYMKKQQMDFDEAFDILGIEEEKYDAYRDKIEEEERQPKLVRPGRSR